MASNAEIIVKVVDQATPNIRKVETDLKKIDSTAKTTRSSFLNLNTAVAAFAGALSIRAIGSFLSTVQTLDNRIKLVTNSQEELNSTFNVLLGIANRSRGDLEGVVDLYTKIALSTKDLGISQEQTAQVTETFAKALALSGADAQSAAGAIRQFGQALASGAFRGDEFNSVVEAAPIILDILAKETGKARGEIRALAADGALTAEVLINALLGAANDVDAGYAKTSATIGQSLTILQNNFLALGRSASPAAEAIAQAIGFLANNLENAVVFVGSFIAAFAAGKLLAIVAGIGNITKAVTALNLAIRANPIGLVATLIATAVTLIVNNFDGLANTVKGSFNAIQRFGLETKIKLLELFEDAVNGIYQAFLGVGNFFTKIFGKDLLDGVDRSQKKLVDFSGTVKDAKDRVAQLEKESENYKKTSDKVASSVEGQDKAVSKLDLSAKKLEKQIKAVDAASDKYLKTLKEEAKLAALSSEEREIQIEVTKAYEQVAKDAGIAVEELTEIQRKNIEQTVRNTITEKQQNEELRKSFEENLKKRQDAYDQFAQNAKTIRQNDLSDIERYNQSVSQIESFYADESIKKSQTKDEIMQTNRKKFIQDYITGTRSFQFQQLTDEEKFREEMRVIEEVYADASIAEEADKQAAIAQIRQKYAEKYIDIAKQQTISEMSIFEQHAKSRADLEAAVNAGIITDYNVLAANRRKIDNDFINGVKSEYSSLYGWFEGKTREFIGLSNEEFGILRDSVKLIFGTDIQNVIAGVFANGIGAIGSFGTQSTGILDAFKFDCFGIFNGIGGKANNTFLGVALEAVKSFGSKAFDIMISFGSGIYDVLGDIGSWMIRNFGSIFDTVVSGASSVIRSISGIFGRSGGGFFSTVGSFFGGIGSAIGGILDWLFASGGVVNQGKVVEKYASGGIVGSPTIFPMANGMGLMGEAGPEAIMPLERVNGQLGVRSNGGGDTNNITVNFQVQTIDSTDFETMLYNKKEFITNSVREAINERGRRFA